MRQSELGCARMHTEYCIAWQLILKLFKKIIYLIKIKILLEKVELNLFKYTKKKAKHSFLFCIKYNNYIKSTAMSSLFSGCELSSS